MSGRKSVLELRMIVENIKNINNKLNKNMSLTEKENYFFENYPDIMKEYPFLVSQICSGTDLQMLETMFQQMEAMEKGTKSKETVDKELGEKLGDTYINK